MNEQLKNLILNNTKFYAEKFLKIKTKKGTLALFKFNPAQEKLDAIVRRLESENKPIRVIILKARQMGFSTWTEGKTFHRTSTRPFVNSLIVAHEDKATQNLFAMSKLFYDELPEFIRPMKKYSNGTELVFENPTQDPDEKAANPGLRSSVRVATAGNSITARSMMIHVLHASEVAFWPDPYTLMTGLLQCVPDEPNTMIVIESTANGVGGYFYDLWQAAEKGENDYLPLFFGWFEDPTYTRPFASVEEKEQFIADVNAMQVDTKTGEVIHSDEYLLKEAHSLTYEQLNWRRWTIKNKLNGDVLLFQQEYPATPEEAFIASGRMRFNKEALAYYKAQCTPGIRGFLQEDDAGNVSFVRHSSGCIEIWEMPQKDKSYVIGADVAEGLSTGDYSVGGVADEFGEVVCAWRGHLDPDLFGIELVKLAKFYNEAYIGCEANNHGLTTLKAIESTGYYNIYWRKVYDQFTDKLTKKIGWLTTTKTKPLVVNKLAEWLREKKLKVRWAEFIKECYTYIIEDNGATNAQQGCHDDTVMALALMIQMLLESTWVEHAAEDTDGYERQNRRRAVDRDEDETSLVEVAN